MENNPLVTVNILTYNRRDDLRITLQNVSSQNYKNIEVIIIDNDSNDGTGEMIRSEFPFVKYIRLEKNIGIAGWNEGFKSAKGEYILVLDDDSYPTDDTIQKGLSEFSQNRNLGIVAFNVFNFRLQKSETDNFMSRPYLFNGCGALIRKKVIDDVGFFNEQIFVYYHELDYSVRVYNCGYGIKYLPDAVVIHRQSFHARNLKSYEDPFRSRFRYYHYFISYSIFLLQRFYLRYSLFYLFKWIMNRLIICVRFGYYKTFAKALFYLLANSIRILKKREVLNDETQKFYRYGNEALIDRTYFPNFKKPKFF